MGARVGVLGRREIRSGARDRIRTCVAVKAAVLQTAGISRSPTRAGTPLCRPPWPRSPPPKAWSPRRDLNPQPSAYKAAALPLRHSGTPRAQSDGRQRESTALPGGHREVYGGPLATINASATLGRPQTSFRARPREPSAPGTAQVAQPSPLVARRRPSGRRRIEGAAPSSLGMTAGAGRPPCRRRHSYR